MLLELLQVVTSRFAVIRSGCTRWYVLCARVHRLVVGHGGVRCDSSWIAHDTPANWTFDGSFPVFETAGCTEEPRVLEAISGRAV